MAEILYNQPVVIDNGSGNLKAGFAGEDKPKSYASAIIGRPKYQKIMAAGSTSLLLNSNHMINYLLGILLKIIVDY